MKTTDCHQCNGKGVVRVADLPLDRKTHFYKECSYCDGTGDEPAPEPKMLPDPDWLSNQKKVMNAKADEGN